MADLTLQTLIELRGEVREFRDEARKTALQHEHRLNLLTELMRDQSNRLAQLETHMAALLATMPHVHTRIDDLAGPQLGEEILLRQDADTVHAARARFQRYQHPGRP